MEMSARVSPGGRVIHFGNLDSLASSKVDSGNHSHPIAEPAIVSVTKKSRNLSMLLTILNICCSSLHGEIYLRLEYTPLPVYCTVGKRALPHTRFVPNP